MLGLNHQTRTETTQQTRDIQPRFVYCWPSVVDSGPALNQRRLVYAGNEINMVYYAKCYSSAKAIVS